MVGVSPVVGERGVSGVFGDCGVGREGRVPPVVGASETLNALRAPGVRRLRLGVLAMFAEH